MILACMLVGLKSLVILLDYRLLFLYFCSYNLGGSMTVGIRARFNTKHVICVLRTKVFVCKNQF
jgi:hypothetical protein